jgi:hypothetical protein
MHKWSDTQTYALRVDVQQQRQSEPLHLRDTSNFYYLKQPPPHSPPPYLAARIPGLATR